MASIGDEESLSDASLIEVDSEMDFHVSRRYDEDEMVLDDDVSDASSTIHLSGDPVTAPATEDDDLLGDLNINKSFEVIDSPFHGFHQSEVLPRKIVYDDGVALEFSELNQPIKEALLRSDYDGLQPFYNITPPPEPEGASRFGLKRLVSSKATSLPGQQPATVDHAAPAPKQKRQEAQALPTMAAMKPSPRSAAPPMTRESREWKPSAQFFTPFLAGWVRELVFDRDQDGQYQAKPREVIYHSPQTSHFKSRQFRSLTELSSFLSTSVADLTLHNFSFRKEPMNAPKGQEVCHAVDEEVDIFQHTDQAEETSPALAATSNATPERRKSTTMSADQSKFSSESTGHLKMKIFNRGHRDGSSATYTTVMTETSVGKSSDQSRAPHNPASGQNLESGDKIRRKQVFTPVSNQRTKTFGNFSSMSRQCSPMGTHHQLSVNHRKTVLRPTKMSPVTCSIHCQLASGIPELSCCSCQALFHPLCVGLNEGVNYASYDFYCFQCTPPVEKENNVPFTSAFGKKTSAPTGGQRNVPDDSNDSNLNSRKPASSRAKRTLRPLEAQTVVNIGGIKYLVVPHPSNPTSDRSSKGSSDSAKDKDNKKETKLPILLRPVNDNAGVSESEMPVFEVSEAGDGRLLLTRHHGPANDQALLTSRAMIQNCARSSGGQALTNFHSYFSNTYSSLLKVFGYLSIPQLLTAARVCRSWHHLAMHPALWCVVNISKLQISNWTKFGEHLLKTRVSRLMIDNPKAVRDLPVQALVPYLCNIKELDCRRMDMNWLRNLITQLAAIPITNLQSIQVSELELPHQSHLDLSALSNINGLHTLKLRISSGSHKVDGITAFTNTVSQSLSSLSILNSDGIRLEHVHAIGRLDHLSQLELGNVSHLDPVALFTQLSQMTQLTGLRLEDGRVGEEIGYLKSLCQLANLELVHFELQLGFGSGLAMLQSISKLLMIPVYRQQAMAAELNAEIVDTSMTLSNLTHFFFGITNEALLTINSAQNDNAKDKDNFPLMMNGQVEWYSLCRLYKLLMSSMPNAKRVKILKLPKKAAIRQSLSSMK